jgi:hypothetical protein
MQMMVVVVFAPQVPIAADLMPTGTIPTPVDAQSVTMTADFAVVVAPEPARSFVVVITSPQVPVGANTTPVTLMVAIQGSQTVQVNSNAPIAAPSPSVPTMEMVVVIISAVEMPITPHLVPPSTIPAPEDA